MRSSKKHPTRKSGKRTTTGKAGPATRRPAEAQLSTSSASEIIDMQEAIDLLKTTRPTFYRWLRSGRIKGMKVGRQWRFYRADIERFMKGEPPRIDLTADISPLNKILQNKLMETGGGAKATGGSEIEKTLNLILSLGILSGASDIHLEPLVTHFGAAPVGSLRFRIDGVLHDVTSFDTRLVRPIVSELKRMAGCDISAGDKPQSGQVPADSGGWSGGSVRRVLGARVNTMPAGLGESATVRILESFNTAMDLDAIDYSERDLRVLKKALKEPWGLIVISGPTGSGKTTVLYACLNELTGPSIKAVSVEDPIEYYLPWVNQIAVNSVSGMSFANTVRAVLRTDPDVVMIADMRDRDTLESAIEAALTGHLVLTQLHANDTVRALRRMLDFGVDPAAFAEAARLILSQRLVRKPCPECGRGCVPSPEETEQMKQIAQKGGLDPETLPENFRSTGGCEKCSGTGYRKRTIVAEVMEITPEVAEAVRAGMSVEEIGELAVSQGMTTMSADGIRQVARGETTLAEASRVLGYGSRE